MEVDPQQYYSGASVCSDLADTIHSALKENDATLRTCGEAAGSDSTGKEWAATYNTRIEEFYALVYNSLLPALDNYAGILQQGGYNWALANYNARHDKAGQQPPTKPGPRPRNTRKLGLINVANGPGNGLKDGSIGLANAIGIPVPDGNTDQLQQVADAWKALAAQKSEIMRAPLRELANKFGSSNSPDAPDIVDDLHDLQSVIEDVVGMLTELGDMVQDQKNDVDHLRRELLVAALQGVAMEVGTKAVLAFASSWVTFGLSMAVGSAAIAAAVAKWAPRIAKIIEQWNEAKVLRQAAKEQADLDGPSKKADDIKNRKAQDTDEPEAPGKQISPPDRGAVELPGVRDPKSFDPQSLSGRSADEIARGIPSDWTASPSKSGGGTVYRDPDNFGRQIRIMPGYPDGNRPDPLTHGPYAEVSQNGKTTKIPLEGNPTLEGN